MLNWMSSSRLVTKSSKPGSRAANFSTISSMKSGEYSPSVMPGRMSPLNMQRRYCLRASGSWSSSGQRIRPPDMRVFERRLSNSSRSTTMTELPARSTVVAVVAPATPKPSTTTSAS